MPHTKIIIGLCIAGQTSLGGPGQGTEEPFEKKLRRAQGLQEGQLS